MLDAGFASIPFCSVNLTGRRDFFCGVTKMGFPHCETVEQICALILEYEKTAFRDNFNKAVDIYNAMTESD